MKKQQARNKQISFKVFVAISTIITIILALYISYMIFSSKNSYKVYSALKEQKQILEYDIKLLQYKNAKLQKEFFELKNLEPEWEK